MLWLHTKYESGTNLLILSHFQHENEWEWYFNQDSELTGTVEKKTENWLGWEVLKVQFKTSILKFGFYIYKEF